MIRLGKQAGTLRANHPAAWATGEAFAVDLLADRSPDLIRLIHERGQEGINFYMEQASEKAIKAAWAGEFDIGEPATKDALLALGIACGMKIDEVLQAEAQGR